MHTTGRTWKRTTCSFSTLSVRNLVPAHLYESLLESIRLLHYSKNETEFKHLFHEFSKKWNKKATKAFYEYFRTQWVKRNTDNLNSNSRFWRWRIFDKPPGFAATNSPIECFNKTIKRDFSMRRRFSVLRTISMIKRIIGVYSRPDENNDFSNDRKPDKPLRDKAVLIKKEFFKCVSKTDYTYSLKFNKKTYNLDLKAQTCDCRVYVK